MYSSFYFIKVQIFTIFQSTYVCVTSSSIEWVEIRVLFDRIRRHYYYLQMHFRRWTLCLLDAGLRAKGACSVKECEWYFRICRMWTRLSTKNQARQITLCTTCRYGKLALKWMVIYYKTRRNVNYCFMLYNEYIAKTLTKGHSNILIIYSKLCSFHNCFI